MVRLPRSFFARDTRAVAQALLGCTLVHALPDGTRLCGRIVETEAYGPGDQASHSYRGRTARNAPMFMRPGTAYVYLIYGMHFCFNISTEAEGVGAAVLIRALEPLEGVEVMQDNRWRGDRFVAPANLCRGPGNLCKAMALGQEHSGADLCRRGSTLYIVTGEDALQNLIQTSPRIAVSGDGLARTIPWRFYVAGNPSVSGPKAARG